MLFLGLLYEKNKEKEILNLSKDGLSNPVNKFQWSLIEGLSENMDKDLEIINVLPVGPYPKSYKKIFLETHKWKYKDMTDNMEIGTINIPVLKQFSRYRKIKKEILEKIKQGKKVDDILIYSTYLPFLRAVYKLDKTINVTLIVTDLPEFYDFVEVSFLRKILRNINNKMIYKYLERVDKFVLLTEEMKTPLQVGERPYVVVEGLIDCNYNEKIDNIENYEENNKVILYTGSLRYKFGIGNLLEAFKRIKDKNYELWLCGFGEAEQEIKQLAQKDSRIKFFGYLTSEEIMKLQQRCTVLINPRQNEGEYTKYSFPSKTMEYLLSGKPVISYKLDGIPNEYDNYISYVDSNRINDLTEKIIEVCEKSKEERQEIGRRSREFVLKEKNCVAQATKVLRMIRK